MMPDLPSGRSELPARALEIGVRPAIDGRMSRTVWNIVAAWRSPGGNRLGRDARRHAGLVIER